MRAPDRGRSGVVLLECVIALAIFATAGIALLSLATEARHAARRALEAEARVSRADEYLSRISLWSTDDLDRHLGERRQGPWTVEIRVSTAQLYDVHLRDSTGVELLATTLYRPDSAAANR